MRAEAARLVAAVRFEQRSLKSVLPEALDRINDSRDRALCEAMAFEALRWLPRYEFWLQQLLNRPLPEAARPVHALLLVGLAQLDAMKLADYAAISTTAEAARRLHQPHLVGLVNAVLRRFLRERDALQALALTDAVAASAHPRWLLEALQRDWPEQVETLTAHNNQQAPLWLRVNARKISLTDYQKLLTTQGIHSSTSTLAPNALRLQSAISPTALPGWDDGLVSVQDLSAQLAAPLLEVPAGARVLDLGAAPGGKSAHILETFPHLGELVAVDIEAARMTRVEATLARLGLKAHCIVGDAGTPESWWDGQPFQRILLDAPCSATGVIRRQPDIKWHRRQQDIAALVDLQARLLDAAWPMLDAGGRLVYATCSVLRDENERQIDAFLARTPAARAITLPPELGLAAGVGVQRLPEAEGGDGFYLAVLEKSAASGALIGAGQLR